MSLFLRASARTLLNFQSLFPIRSHRSVLPHSPSLLFKVSCELNCLGIVSLASGAALSIELPDVAFARPSSSCIHRSPDFRPFPHAHILFATSCGLNSPDTALARRSSSPIIQTPGFLPIVATAHSVFANSCRVNSIYIASAHPSNSPIN
jgi:hypothetical protein